jgi:DNA-binding transcriptional LysR family regulator
MYEWGDVKFFLATARAGSTLRAARELRVSQTTVARRIHSLEKALSVRLFDRHRDGYRLNEAGTTILKQAERVAKDAETLERLATEQARHLSGVIRVTTVEDVADAMLTPLLAEFIDQYPDIRVDVIATERRLDLSRGEADIAIRASNSPAEPGTTVRKLAEGRWSLYCSRAYASKHGTPKRTGDLHHHLIIGVEGPMAKVPAVAWLAAAAPRSKVRTMCSTFSNALAAVKSGNGIAALPRSMAARHPDLIECLGVPNSTFGFYLVTRQTMKDVPRVKAFIEFLLVRLPALKRAMEGARA